MLKTCSLASGPVFSRLLLISGLLILAMFLVFQLSFD